jgi:hypothetical protein
MASPTLGDFERCGRLLISEGLVTEEELLAAIGEAGAQGTPIAALLESSGSTRLADLAGFLASRYRFPRIPDLRRFPWKQEAAKSVPEGIARKHDVLGVARLGNVLCIARSNVYPRAAVQEIRKATGLRVKVVQADAAQVRACLDHVYGGRLLSIPAPEELPEPSASPSERDTELILAPSVSVPGAPGRRAALDPIRIGAAEARLFDADSVRQLAKAWDALHAESRPLQPLPQP